MSLPSLSLFLKVGCCSTLHSRCAGCTVYRENIFPPLLKTADYQIALQVLRTSFLGPRACFFSPCFFFLLLFKQKQLGFKLMRFHLLKDRKYMYLERYVKVLFTYIYNFFFHILACFLAKLKNYPRKNALSSPL